MKWILSGIALVALLSACDDASTDGSSDTEEDSGASNPAADDDEPMSDDDEGDEPMSDDDEGDEPMSDDDAVSTDDDAGAVPMFPPPPDPISCGDVDCPAPPLGVPCCTTAGDVEVQAAINEGACGVNLSTAFGGPSNCVEFDQPGELDESCPAMEIPGAPSVPGCCNTFGVCGTADTFIGIGCATPPPEFGELIPCGEGAGDAGMSMPGSDAGSDAGTEPIDAGAVSDPMPDAGMSSADAGAGDASR